MVAPNSPSDAANPSTAPDSRPGAISGKVTAANTRQRLAPSVRAAASRPASTASSAWRMARTIKGSAITAAASTAPLKVKTNCNPKVSLSQRPNQP